VSRAPSRAFLYLHARPRRKVSRARPNLIWHSGCSNRANHRISTPRRYSRLLNYIATGSVRLARITPYEKAVVRRFNDVTIPTLHPKAATPKARPQIHLAPVNTRRLPSLSLSPLCSPSLPRQLFTLLLLLLLLVVGPSRSRVKRTWRHHVARPQTREEGTHPPVTDSRPTVCRVHCRTAAIV